MSIVCRKNELRHGNAQPRLFTIGHGLGSQQLKAVSLVRSMSGGFQKAPGQNQGELDAAKEPDSGPAAHEKMAIVFTCKTCEARVQRVFSKRSYERGVVIVRVEKEDGCHRKDEGDHCLHLIADNMGWFEDQPTNVEKLLAQQGEAVQRLVLRDWTQTSQSATGGEEGGARDKVLIKTDTGKTVELYEEDAGGAGPPSTGPQSQ